MKKNLYFLIMLISVSFISCTTVGIAKPSVPMDQSCIIIYGQSDLLGAFIQYGTFFLNPDNKRYITDYQVVPAGQQRLVFSKSYRRILYSRTDHGRDFVQGHVVPTQTTTTISATYNEIWDITYNFEPGKYYTFHLTAANVMVNSYDNNVTYIVSTDTPHVSVNRTTVRHNSGVNVEVREVPLKEFGSIYINPKVSANLSLKLYDYENSAQIGGGSYAGVHLLDGWLNMFVGAEANVHVGTTYPLGLNTSEEGPGGITGPTDRNFGLILSYDYGALVKFSLGSFVIHGGAGMGNGHIWAKRNIYENENDHNSIISIPNNSSYKSIPYIEAGLGHSRFLMNAAVPSVTYYARYYLSEDNNNFGKINFGLRLNIY